MTTLEQVQLQTMKDRNEQLFSMLQKAVEFIRGCEDRDHFDLKEADAVISGTAPLPQTSPFEQAIARTREDQRRDRHNEIHAKLWDMRLHEIMTFRTESFDGSPIFDWCVMRVQSGWTYCEDNPRIARAPLTFFVPLPVDSSQ